MSFSMSTRSSPFRRAGSPSSPSAYRAVTNTPPSTSRAQPSPLSSPSKLKHSYTVSEEEEEESMIITPTKSSDYPKMMRVQPQDVPASPSSARKLPQPPAPATAPTPAPRVQQQQSSYTPSRPTPARVSSHDNLSRLPPALLHSLRESFSVLDSNSTGTLNPSSVAETLQSLGLGTDEMAQLFPPGQAPQVSLPQYLNSLAAALASISPQQELLNALSAFDDDDRGQVDVAELRRALLTTPPEPGERALSERDIDDALLGFTGRRTLGKGGFGLSGLKGPGASGAPRNGDVFRYREFVANLSGGPDPHQGQALQAR